MQGLKEKWKELTEGPAGWIIYLLLGVVLALALNKGLGLALSTRYPVVTVKSGSMVPTLNVGDIVFVYGRGEYRPGDIAVFDGWRKAPIIHRIVAKTEKGKTGGVKVKISEGLNSISRRDLKKIAQEATSRNLYVTKGDNNPICDQCPGSGKDFLTRGEIYGKEIFRIPYLGWIKLGTLKVLDALVY